MDQNELSKHITITCQAFRGVAETLVRNGFTGIQLVSLPSFITFYSGNELFIDNDFNIDSITRLHRRSVIVEKFISRINKPHPAIEPSEMWNRPVTTITRRFKSLEDFKKFIKTNNDKLCVLLVDTRLRYEEACQEISNDSYGLVIRLAMVERYAHRP